jgi:hypothetical protein
MMQQLIRAAAFACLLAACGQPAQQAAEQTPAERAASVPAVDAGAPDPMANAEQAGAQWSDVAEAEAIDGAWTFADYGDGVHAGADFTFAGENEAYVQVTCNRAAKQISWWVDAELTPDQATGLGFLLQEARYVFAARSENSEWPNISADVPADDPRLDMIMASESFALQYMGYTPRLPGDPEDLGQVLAFCRETAS